MNEIICPKCGSVNAAEMNFCLNCGFNLSLIKTRQDEFESPRTSNTSYLIWGIAAAVLLFLSAVGLIAAFWFFGRSEGGKQKADTDYASLTEGLTVDQIEQPAVGDYKIVRSGVSAAFAGSIEQKQWFYRNSKGLEVETNCGRFASPEDARQRLLDFHKYLREKVNDGDDQIGEVQEYIHPLANKKVGLSLVANMNNSSSYYITWTNGAFICSAGDHRKGRKEIVREYLKNSKY